MEAVHVQRQEIKLFPDHTRVIARPFIPEDRKRKENIVRRVLSLPEERVEDLVSRTLDEFGKRHRNLEQALERHYRSMADLLPNGYTPTRNRRLLIGSYFTCEYSIEGAALFNPSIVAHPNQDHLPPGSLRFVMSVRAVGEGHISSVEFRTGTINAAGDVTVDPASRFVTTPDILSHDQSQYTVRFPDGTPLSELVLFPVTESERNGIEDARFVRFLDDTGKVTYYATYTAYDGYRIIPRLLETQDFVTFRSLTLRGAGVENKGMALFPRKIDGSYAMISRQDGENLYVMFSHDLCEWNEKQELLKPAFPWEFIQIGNCGSPIETDEGWLLLTHGVGPMRQYCLGAALLDRKNPANVIGRLTQPLLIPNDDEREGYVPNVVYTCGAIAHNGLLLLPYAASDFFTTVAKISMKELLDAMV